MTTQEYIRKNFVIEFIEQDETCEDQLNFAIGTKNDYDYSHLNCHIDVTRTHEHTLEPTKFSGLNDKTSYEVAIITTIETEEWFEIQQIYIDYNKEKINKKDLLAVETLKSIRFHLKETPFFQEELMKMINEKISEDSNL